MRCYFVIANGLFGRDMCGDVALVALRGGWYGFLVASGAGASTCFSEGC